MEQTKVILYNTYTKVIQSYHRLYFKSFIALRKAKLMQSYPKIASKRETIEIDRLLKSGVHLKNLFNNKEIPFAC